MQKVNFPAHTTQRVSVPPRQHITLTYSDTLPPVTHQVTITMATGEERMAGDPRTRTRLLQLSAPRLLGNQTPTPSFRLAPWKCTHHRMFSSPRTVPSSWRRSAARLYSTAR